MEGSNEQKVKILLSDYQNISFGKQVCLTDFENSPIPKKKKLLINMINVGGRRHKWS